MYDLLLLNARYRNRRVDVAISGSQFVAVEPAGALTQSEARERWDASAFLLRAPFYNTHTHHAMTLLRGVGEDCALMPWLEHHIWPLEAHLTPEAVYAGTRLAILESIHSGCVAFNDMYFHQPAVIRAAEEMGVRALVGIVAMDRVSEHFENDATLALRDSLPPTLKLALAPHAIYTTSPELLRRIVAEAQHLELPIHMHAAESKSEHAFAREHYGFESPIAYLEACGILRPGTILAHCCHLSDADRDLLAERGATIAHCPQSNQKLASGAFQWKEASKRGIPITIGTDGAASNNSLSMIAECKSAALNARLASADPCALPLDELDRASTQVAARALGFANAGRIAPGADADLILVNLETPALTGGGSPDANFIYAGDPSCVDTVICAGRVLMRHRVVPHEAEIISSARNATRALLHKAGVANPALED